MTLSCVLSRLSMHNQNCRELIPSRSGRLARGDCRLQNGCWHRALPNYSATPRSIAYFQYCPTMVHPLHRATPYEGDMSMFTPEQRFLMHEPRASPLQWVYGSAEDKVKLDRFRRGSTAWGAAYYQKALQKEAS
eukprot:SAG22_NODE_1390_length_4520_cov_1.529744_3_plen_134_part_00